ncbi:hypothetical protein VNO78_07560 [Psophocarpus tetragonolobus]|uniref:Uncharacterized protein n=1 Tax=Psophocarpus tetragonolobus TaxID=3891 RepID=A0AAN9T3F7_PSOTE
MMAYRALSCAEYAVAIGGARTDAEMETLPPTKPPAITLITHRTWRVGHSIPSLGRWSLSDLPSATCRRGLWLSAVILLVGSLVVFLSECLCFAKVNRYWSDASLPNHRRLSLHHNYCPATASFITEVRHPRQ